MYGRRIVYSVILNLKQKKTRVKLEFLKYILVFIKRNQYLQ